MSASVFKPIRQQHDMARMKTPPPLDRRIGGVQQHDVQKVRRKLFGPVDHEANRRMVEEHLAMHLASGMSRWEFDFRKGVPLNNSNRYIWSIVTPTCKRSSKQYSFDTEVDNVHLYLNPLEDLTPPTQSTDSQSEQPEKMLISPARNKKQTTITDYMIVKKSNFTNTAKRPTEASVSRPPKLPRTSQSSAS